MHNLWRSGVLVSVALVALMIQSIALARAPAYQVELIVYSHITPSTLTSEQWPNVRRAEIGALNTISGYPFLSKQYFRMSDEEANLRRAAGYKVLLHVAWRQPSAGPDSAKSVHIFGGKAFSNSGSVEGQNLYGTQPYDPNLAWQVDGIFSMRVQHFLDTKMAMLFAAPRTALRRVATNYAFDSDPGDIVYFRLKDNRRMRSRELNLVEHPLYGVLVKVFPLNQS